MIAPRMTATTLSLVETYKGRTVLLLGGLGFVGKILLCLFLERLPDIGHIYLVVRAADAESRFLQTARSSPVFEPLRRRLGDRFIPFLQEKVTAIAGDISAQNLGIGDAAIFATLQKRVDLVINSAGLVTFNPSLSDAFSANILGALRAAEFVRSSKQGRLLHISTCYVAGNRSGLIPEALPSGCAPNGTPLDYEQEIAAIQDWIQTFQDPIHVNQKGLERIRQLGWPNLYTYTKALAEGWLAARMGSLSCSIVRPAILESTLSFPFPGWNEGFNTSAPLIKYIHSGYRIVVANKKTWIDIMPADLCAMQILKIGAALLYGKASPVYQCGTSSFNPLTIGHVTRVMSTAYAKNSVWWQKILQWHRLYLVSKSHFLSCFSVYRFLSKIPSTWIAPSRTFRTLVKTFHAYCKLTEIMLPFIHDNNYRFESSAESIQVIEPGWNSSPQQIDWEQYWVEIHMPALEKWCFPKVEVSQ
jgi:long-chain acyl-CoA synthetase